MKSVTNYNQLKLIPKNQMEHWRPKVVTGKRGIPYIYTEEQNGLPTVFVPQDGVRGGSKRSFPLRNATRTVLCRELESLDSYKAFKEEVRNAYKRLHLSIKYVR